MSKTNDKETTAAKDVSEAPAPRKYKIVIHKQGGPGGSDDVVGGVQGKAFQIHREEEVTVSAEVYHALMDAIETRYVMTDDEVHASDRVRFPVSVLGKE